MRKSKTGKNRRVKFGEVCDEEKVKKENTFYSFLFLVSVLLHF
jgi:hypothetical protein